MRTVRLPVAAFVVAAACALALAVLAHVRSGPAERLDVHLDRTLNGWIHGHHAWVSFWQAVSLVGGPTVWDVLGAVVAVVLALRARTGEAVAVVLALVGARVLSTVLKLVIGRPRPTVPHPVAHARGMSFPSTHALTSAAAVAVLVVIAMPVLGQVARRWVVAAAALVVVAIGLSRLMLGVHYLSDVVGGWLIAGLWVAAALRLAQLARRSTP